MKPLLAGICGSDLSTIAGRSSFYFSPLVSTPFVPGHEIVGELTQDCDDLPSGTRVVMGSVLVVRRSRRTVVPELRRRRDEPL